MLLNYFILAGLVTTSVGFLDSLFAQINSNCTTADSYICRNSRCIPKSKRCDGRDDCFDNSDEEDCDDFHCKAPHFFRCKNEVCISRYFVCDTENDCGDYSDEVDCDSFKISLEHPTNCTKGEWQCSDRLCIPEEWVCNGEPDCLDGTDETLGCSKDLHCEGFKCKNEHCIPNEWRCDGYNDCQDNSDELDCVSLIDPKDCILDDRKFLCANNHTCIELKQVCDHTKHCPDGSDENVLCASSTNSCNMRQCSHECVQMPDGPKCLCPKGYHTVDDKTCVDINECEHYGICDQKCKNKPGSYECYCDAKYALQDDKKTCKVVGAEAMMIFSSKTEIRGYFLQSEVYFTIAKNLKQVVGVGFDGHHLYWTDIYSEHESIVRASEDGSRRELIVTSGLGAPEDLAVDWITGNVYFTDSEIQHIGVCTNDGTHCTVLVNKDVRKPRGIALNPAEGEMFWSDWGHPAEIARSRMDGTDDKPFVTENIEWPNGLTIDYPNQRLYWADAKTTTLESVHLDGTDRRVILEGIVRHPYAIAVFENRLYWSDWNTHSVQACDKFTGKNHHTLIKEKKQDIYGIHIFHSALKPQTPNPCSMSFCSDMCLLNGIGYACACPQDKELGPDKHSCRPIEKKQVIIVSTKDVLIRIEHQLLGKHNVMALPTVAKDIKALAYSSTNNTLFISDVAKHVIITMHLDDGTSKLLFQDEPASRIESLAYDYLGNNLYWCDSGKGTVDVLNLNTMSHKILLHDMAGELPTSIAVVPEEGIMFISFKKKDHGYHIDRLRMDGTGRSHVIEQGLLGPIALYYEHKLHRIFWADAGTGDIESTSIEGDDKHGFRTLDSNPMALASLSRDLFWTNQKSKRVYWADKENNGNGYNKKITLDLPDDTQELRIVSVTPRPVLHHPCQQKNGNCSHLCLVSEKSVACTCPLGMSLKSDNATCFKPKSCAFGEFFCKKSDTCIPREMRCNGQKNCFLGEDEEDCNQQTKCFHGEFQCKNGECIRESMVCDMHYDCKDKSDEMVCSEDRYKRKCPGNQYRCTSGLCIADRFVCDGLKDCYGGEDELNCVSSTCAPDQFRCSSGACIPKHWECDHEYDCPDLSDEHSDCGLATCAPNKFTCKNGKCIDATLVCDRMDDCGDMSDELNCKRSPDSHCNLDEFQCTSNKSICIPDSARCNGTSECPHHEDEKDCSECHVDEFECDNKKCLPREWICDGTDDCGDGTDESQDLCAHKKSSGLTAQVFMPCVHGFRCKTGHCIDFAVVCNGEENCYDGSDEQGACNSSCTSNSNPCAHKCIKTPSGPTCACNDGYQLQGDGQSCVDIEECSRDPPICSQLCTEYPGSYTCGCYDQFVLRSDRKSCKSIGESMSMIFTNDNEIRKLSQADNTLTVLYSDDSPSITGLDVSVSSGYVYFSIEQSGTIHRINLKNFTREYLTQVGKPQKLAVDWITQNIYFVDADSVERSIKVCNFHQQLCSKLFSVDPNSQISAIAVDAVNKHIFYSVTTWWIFNSPNSVVYKRSLDGFKSHELVKSTKGYLTGLTFDAYQKKLYYVDQHHGQISQVGYDGTDQKVTLSNLTRPFGLSLFEDHLYFLSNSGYMGKCKLYGEERSCDTFRLNAYSSEFFAISQSSRQPNAANICRGANCTHMCVPADGGPRCLCENGKFVHQGQQCEVDARTAMAEDKRPNFKTHVYTLKNASNDGSSGSMIAAGILIPVFVLLAAAAAYLFIRRKNTGKFNISMRFYNPMFGVSSNNNDAPGSIIQAGEHEYCNPVDFCSTDMQSATNAILQKVNPLVKIDG